MSDVLEPKAVQTKLAAHPGWSYDGAALIRTFDRGDFKGSVAFINAVADIANRLDHHPDLALSWNEVVVRTSSHDVDGISARDFALISAIDALAL